MLATVLTLLFLAAVVIAVLLFMVGERLLRHLGPISGVEGLGNEIGVVRTTLSPTGTVYVGGQLWSAQAATDSVIPAGTRVRILDREGLVLTVEPIIATTPGITEREE